MNLTIDRKALLADLPSLVRIADAKNSIPVLHHVQAAIVDGRLELAATDLDTSLRTTAETLLGPKGSAVLLPAKKFLEIVRAMSDGALFFETDDHHVPGAANIRRNRRTGASRQAAAGARHLAIDRHRACMQASAAAGTGPRGHSKRST